MLYDWVCVWEWELLFCHCEMKKRKKKTTNTEIHEYNKKKKIHYTSSHHRQPPTMKLNKKTRNEEEAKEEAEKKLRQISSSQMKECATVAAFSIIKIFLLTKQFVCALWSTKWTNDWGEWTKLCIRSILYIRMYNLLYLFYCVCNAIFQFERRRSESEGAKNTHTPNTHIPWDDGSSEQRTACTREHK